MSFNYCGYLSSIKIFYYSMKEINVKIGTFYFTYNGVSSDVILDTRNVPWNLVFIKKGGQDTLSLSVERYHLIVRGDEKYKEFINFFNISGAKGVFKISDFVRNFNDSIPKSYIIDDKTRETVISYDVLDSENEGIYPIGIKNWELIHARNPQMAKSKYHRRPENLMKTRELYPKIYSVIKDMDISVMYGKSPNDITDSLKKGKI